jgi:hypothetical protein
MFLTAPSTNMLATMPADSTQRTLLERISELGRALEALSALWTFVSFKTDMLFAATGTGSSSSLKRQPPKQQFEVELGNISQYLLFNNAVVSNMTLFQFGAKRMKAPDKWESPWKENEYPSTELEADDGSHSESAEPEGISIIVASGDRGVWGREGYDSTLTFNPDFPGGSPYVTTVGGTDFTTKSTIGKESVWSCAPYDHSIETIRKSAQNQLVGKTRWKPRNRNQGRMMQR